MARPILLAALFAAVTVTAAPAASAHTLHVTLPDGAPASLSMACSPPAREFDDSLPYGHRLCLVVFERERHVVVVDQWLEAVEASPGPAATDLVARAAN
ncbi:MAG: hypothetical protein ACXIUZ_07085 [Lysobacteraceae bacterium]